jgi:hypothetical protein
MTACRAVLGPPAACPACAVARRSALALRPFGRRGARTKWSPVGFGEIGALDIQIHNGFGFGFTGNVEARRELFWQQPIELRANAHEEVLPCAFRHIGTKITPDTSIWSAAIGQLT